MHPSDHIMVGMLSSIISHVRILQMCGVQSLIMCLALTVVTSHSRCTDATERCVWIHDMKDCIINDYAAA